MKLKIFLLFYFSIIASSSSTFRLTDQRLLQSTQTSCPKIAFQESYKTSYQTAFSIQPTFTQSCSDGKKYIIVSANTSNQAFSFINSTKTLALSDWSKLAGSSYYNISLLVVMKEGTSGQNVTISDYFFFVVGDSTIYFQSLGAQTFSYNQQFTLDYSTAYDPEYSKTGQLTVSWTCSSNFFGCSFLGKTNSFDPTLRIQMSKLVFDYTYSFTVTIQNTNVRRRVATDNISIYIKPPQADSQPLGCIEFSLNIVNITIPSNQITQNEVQIIIDSLNYTDIRLQTPNVNIGRCSSQFTGVQNYYTFSSFSNPNLFSDLKSYPYNGTDIVITKNQLYQAFMISKTLQLTSYVYLIDNTTNKINGFQYVTLTIKLNDKSLYAVPKYSFIQLDSDKILYLDASQSYDGKDSANTNYNFVWGIDSQPSVTFSNSKQIMVYPTNRTRWGVNSLGTYYSYSVKIRDTTRESVAAPIQVQITPGQDSSSCILLNVVTIDSNYVEIDPIWPLKLTAVITTKNCSNTQLRSLVWESPQASNQFWKLDSTNKSFTVESAALKSQTIKGMNYSMRVTQYYRIGSVEYASRYNFNLLIKREYLVPKIDYQPVINLREANLMLDASGSYGTYDVSSGDATRCQCQWKCPQILQAICAAATYAWNNCTVSLSSVMTIQDQNYKNMLNVAFPFTVSIQKGSLWNQTTVYVIITEKASAVLCSIKTINELSLNQYGLLSAVCPSNMNSINYQWNVYDSNDQNINNALQGIDLTKQFLRIPPYTLFLINRVKITVAIQSGSTVQTYGIYKESNVNTQFQTGQIGINYNQLTAYLSNLIITPSNNIYSKLSQKVSFQLRIKDQTSPNQFRIILAKTDANSQNPMTTIMPPLSLEQTLYIDVVDLEGNFYTVNQPLNSVVDILMTASSLNIKISNIVNSANSFFNEFEFEQNVYKIRTLLQAYGNDQMNLQGQPLTYFKTICENVILYLSNYLIIDSRLDSIQSDDRVGNIRQQTIEIIFFITRKHKDLANISDLINLLSYMTSRSTSWGNMIMDTSVKVYEILYSLLEVSYISQYDSIFFQFFNQWEIILQPGEIFSYSRDGTDLIITQLSSDSKALPDLSYLQYNKATVQSKAGNQGLFAVYRNSTFMHISIYDKNLKAISITGLSQTNNISFPLSSDYINKYKAGNLSVYCFSRDSLSTTYTNVTSKIKLGSVDTTQGIVICQASQFSLYSVQYKDFSPPVIKPNDTNQNQSNGNQTNNQTNGTDDGEQNIDGKWNDTLGPQTKQQYKFSGSELILIFNDEPEVMVSLSILTLAFFILFNLIICIIYKGESRDYSTNKPPPKFGYYPGFSLFLNRIALYKKILVQFSPYANLFCIYNKFLPRWIRSTLLQIYFMTLSLIFGVNQALLSYDLSEIGKISSIQLIGISIIGLSIVLLIRPWAVLFFCKLLYEPSSKVQDFNPNIIKSITSSLNNSNLKMEINEENSGNYIKSKESSRLNRTGQIFANNFQRDNKIIMENHPDIGEEVSHFEDDHHQEVNVDQKTGRRHGQTLYSNEEEKQNEKDIFQEIKIDSIKKPKKKKLINKKKPQIIKKASVSIISSDSDNQIIQQENPQEFKNIHDQSFGDQMSKGLFDKMKKNEKIESKNDLRQSQDLKSDLRSSQELKLPKIFQFGSIQAAQSNLEDENLAPIIPPTPYLQQEQNQIFESQQTTQQNGFKSTNFEDFNYLVNTFDNNDDKQQYEGGSEEDIEERELHRDNEERLESVNDESYIQNAYQSKNGPKTNILLSGSKFSNHSPEALNTPHQSGVSQEQKLLDAKLKIIGKHDSFSAQNEILLEEETLMHEGKTFFVNKIIGKFLLLIVWVFFIVTNIYCLKNMTKTEFENWIILSLVSFAFILLVVDPILYWILAVVMMRNDQKISYYTNKINSPSGCGNVFVLLLIGKSKMRDLRRSLNPPISQIQPIKENP